MRFLCHLILLGLFFPGSMIAQTTLPRDIFVLVDVSGSMVGDGYGIGYSKVREAKNLVRDLLTDNFDWSKHPNWQYSLLSPQIQAITSQAPARTPLLEAGSRLFLKRFGDPATSKIAARERLVTDPERDVDSLFANFPPATEFDNQRTFLWLARAMTRREAMARNLSSYLLVEITDAREDKENIVDADDEVAVREFKSLKHVPVSGEIGAFTHKQTQGEYVLQVNIRLVRLAGDAGATNSSAALLSNLRLPSGLRHGDDAVISWDSFNVSGGLSYTVSLQSPGGTKQTQTTQIPSVTFPALKAGDHAVTVSAPGGASLQDRFEVEASASPATSDQLSRPSEIILQSPQRNAEITSGTVTVTWRVVDPPPDSKYIVTIYGPPGSPNIPKKTIDGTRTSFSIGKAGFYRIRVAATARGVKPASGTFVVKSQAGKKLLYFLLTLLPIAIVVVAAVKHARKRRHGEEDLDSYSGDLD